MGRWPRDGGAWADAASTTANTVTVAASTLTWPSFLGYRAYDVGFAVVCVGKEMAVDAWCCVTSR
jgi:hypothetical protein